MTEHPTDQAVADFLSTGQPECPRCGHGLAGLRSAVCPECGAKLVLRLATTDAPRVTIPAAWVLSWNVCAGAAWAAYMVVMYWQMYEAVWGRQTQRISFVAFFLEANMSVTGIYTVAGLLGVLIGGLCLLLAWKRPKSPTVARLIVWFCAISLVASVLLILTGFFE